MGFGPANWRASFRALAGDVRKWWFVYLGFIGFFSLVFFARPRIHKRLEVVNELAAQQTCIRFRPTAEAMALMFTASCTIPIVLIFLGWRMSDVGGEGDFNASLSRAISRIGLYVWSFGILVFLCRDGGVAESHFQWRRERRALMLKHIRWYLPVGLPFAFVVAMLQGQPNELWQNTLGRSCLLVFLACASVVTHCLLRPRGPMFRGLLFEDKPGIGYRLRHVWYTFCVGMPVGLLWLVVIGYYYTAYMLTYRWVSTLNLFLLAVLAASLLLRWVRVRRRRLAMEQRRQQAMAAGETLTGQVAIDLSQETQLDLDQIGHQSRQLIKYFVWCLLGVGIWVIWVDVLPALGLLNQVELWTSPAGDGSTYVTLHDFLVAGVIILVSILALRDLPGVLELFLFPRLPLDAGARYAIVMIVRYVIFIGSAVAALNVVGFRWAEFQWVVAAATVGLGFGLQEILGNFVSGLIILVERPVRVGDVVTIDKVTGVVSRIRMRATIVTNWDRQEFIIPNKELVTGRVTNWSLTNTINRVVINVTVSRDEDPDNVRGVLLDVAKDHPVVLDDPGPIATFSSIEDGRFGFVLRCYLPNMDNRLGTIHELHTSVAARLNEAGIDIAMPKRDIRVQYLDSADATADREAAGTTMSSP